jgi:hypothetical protein
MAETAFIKESGSTSAMERIVAAQSDASHEEESRRATIFPPFKLGKMTLEESFPFEEFIPPQLLVHCDPRAIIDNPRTKQWVKDLLEKKGLADSRAKEEKLKRQQVLCQLALMQHLLEFRSSGRKALLDMLERAFPRQGGAKGYEGSIPTLLLEYFLNLFALPFIRKAEDEDIIWARRNPKDAVDAVLSTTAQYKIHCYICVLALLIHSCDGVDLVALVQELPGMTVANLETVFKQLGCKITRSRAPKDSNKEIAGPKATLQLPLNFPDSKRVRLFGKPG